MVKMFKMNKKKLTDERLCPYNEEYN